MAGFLFGPEEQAAVSEGVGVGRSGSNGPALTELSPVMIQSTATCEHPVNEALKCQEIYHHAPTQAYQKANPNTLNPEQPKILNP